MLIKSNHFKLIENKNYNYSCDKSELGIFKIKYNLKTIVN